MVRESPSASALRIVERDLRRSMDALRRLAGLVDDAARRLEQSDPQYAQELRLQAWSLAYGSNHRNGAAR